LSYLIKDRHVLLNKDIDPNVGIKLDPSPKNSGPTRAWYWDNMRRDDEKVFANTHPPTTNN
jgi:hypothetical protein